MTGVQTCALPISLSPKRYSRSFSLITNIFFPPSLFQKPKTYGRNKELICGKKIISPEPVQTVDECFFVIESSIFAKYQFPQKDGWHLYAVEYCLKMLKCGYSNYAIPAKIWHMSDGVKGLNTAYVKRIKEIIKENKREFGVIYTTIKPWPTGGIRLFVMIYVNYFKWGLKEVLRR